MKDDFKQVGALYIHLNANAEDYPDGHQNLFDTILQDFSGLEIYYDENMNFKIGTEVEILDLSFVEPPQYFNVEEDVDIVSEPETLKQAMYALFIDAWEVHNITIADGNVCLYLKDIFD
ncbi:hypothetical protein [Pedobacter sp.]|uniref:hypothetical protein n=1 Tax=Pedobacter sp. TaxID=1411316 RepID=UPI003C4A143E